MGVGYAKRSMRALRRFASYVSRMTGFTDIDAQTRLLAAGQAEAIDGDKRPAEAPRVMMLGLRGLPDVQGGVEKHVEQLALHLRQANWAVEVVARSPYVKQRTPYVWNGIRVLPFWSPTSPKLEAIVHTFVGVLHAAWTRPDILHLHAIGPSLFVPLARMFGLNVVVTHHGFDYHREKWGFVARTALRLGEYVGMRFAHGRIAVAENIAQTTAGRYAVPVKFIPNGVSADINAPDTGVLAAFGLSAKRYVVIVSRIVPEKRQLDLIEAFAQLPPSDRKLAIVGSGDEASTYLGRVKAAAAQLETVVCTGQQSGADLATLFRNAALFVLPSSHEGMPIAVLEALAYRVPVVVSDIPANLALGLPSDAYFPVGNVAALAEAMTAMLGKPEMAGDFEPDGSVEALYSWSKSCDQTLEIYRSVLVGTGEAPALPAHGLHPAAK